MKKIIIALVFICTIAVLAISCRSSKPPCPAYRSQVNTEIPSNIN